MFVFRHLTYLLTYLQALTYLLTYATALCYLTYLRNALRPSVDLIGTALEERLLARAQEVVSRGRELSFRSRQAASLRKTQKTITAQVLNIAIIISLVTITRLFLESSTDGR